uniref:Cardiolipin synthase N-terminal domain-containing protein n=1 Tax=Picea sitchensis TaxID=3332 RepID=A9NYW8_PICSI|nr:unknown [Picea sitchensis]
MEFTTSRSLPSKPISAISNQFGLIHAKPAFSYCNKLLVHKYSSSTFTLAFNHCPPIQRSSRPHLLTAVTTRRKQPLSVCRSGSDDLNINKNGNGSEWLTSILLFGLWAALLYYVFVLSPNQTANRDFYFLRKLLNLEGDDGFQMNPVLVSLWYIMGFWPLVYSMLLLPTGRSSKNKVPVWPFLVMSFFGGAYALIPYFVLWRPPPPVADKEETERWPLKVLESKITAVIHATCIDFLTLSSLSPFWVYNDMTIRNWFNKGYWLLPLTLVPYLGPTLYLALRPPLPSAMVTDEKNR